MKRDAIGRDGPAHRLPDMQFASTVATPAAAMPRGEFARHAVHQSFEPGHLAVIHVAEFQFRQGLVQQVLGGRTRMNQIGALHAITHPFTELLSQGLNRFKGSGLALFEFDSRLAQRFVTQRVQYFAHVLAPLGKQRNLLDLGFCRGRLDGNGQRAFIPRLECIKERIATQSIQRILTRGCRVYLGRLLRRFC